MSNSYTKGLVSVIIPCYNQEDYIQEAIHSVINQTYSNIECIIVDDGSSDNSAQIIKEYEKTDNRIKCIFQENKGVSHARNNGFLKSKGEFIQFLDADDYIDVSKFEKQINIFEEYKDIDICLSGHQYYIVNKKRFEKYNFKIIEHKLCIEDILFEWDKTVSLPIHAPLFKRVIWKNEELPFVYSRRYEDWVFWVQISLKEAKIKYFDEILATYRMHENNFTINDKNVLINSIKAAFFIKDTISPELQETFINNKIIFFADRYSNSKINKEIYQSTTWKLAKMITKPILFFIPRSIKERIKKKNYL